MEDTGAVLAESRLEVETLLIVERRDVVGGLPVFSSPSLVDQSSQEVCSVLNRQDFWGHRC